MTQPTDTTPAALKLEIDKRGLLSKWWEGAVVGVDLSSLSDEYILVLYVRALALDQYPIDDGLPKSSQQVAVPPATEAETEPCERCEALVMEHLSAQAWCQGVRPHIEAQNADDFVSRMLAAIRAETTCPFCGNPKPAALPAPAPQGETDKQRARQIVDSVGKGCDQPSCGVTLCIKQVRWLTDAIVAALSVPALPAKGCINCGEVNDGGYETEDVGAFCGQCWDYLREYFKAESTAPAVPARPVPGTDRKKPQAHDPDCPTEGPHSGPCPVPTHGPFCSTTCACGQGNAPAVPALPAAEAANAFARGEISSGKLAELLGCDDKHGFKNMAHAWCEAEPKAPSAPAVPALSEPAIVSVAKAWKAAKQAQLEKRTEQTDLAYFVAEYDLFRALDPFSATTGGSATTETR